MGMSNASVALTVYCKCLSSWPLAGHQEDPGAGGWGWGRGIARAELEHRLFYLWERKGSLRAGLRSPGTVNLRHSVRAPQKTV